mgnify:CR=1 FL=1
MKTKLSNVPGLKFQLDKINKNLDEKEIYKILLQSKNLLLNTSMSIQEISDSLKFSSPILFTRFVKQHEGVSPRELRKGL